ncbi:MAG TPA: prepilin-type N-terminal cleavage/methylation domain-containing protein [Burkholderiaceae bacterium]|jgi:general secretion pathway protein J|nr:prepilin-type N-terminal cleavage/methylation domain-containing protein [Burkholderiaceae bacterium]
MGYKLKQAHNHTLRPSRIPGFTLVELLVAISILALVAVIGWRGLDGIIRARVAISADMELTRRMQLTFAQLQSDCAQTASIIELSGRPAMSVADGQLMLLRTIDVDRQPLWFEVVSYRIVDGTLTRSESAPTRDMHTLDQMWRAALEGSDHGAKVNLQSNVSSMALLVWEDGEWVPAQQADLTGAMPGALEVQIKVSGHQTAIVKDLLMGAS